MLVDPWAKIVKSAKETEETIVADLGRLANTPRVLQYSSTFDKLLILRCRYWSSAAGQRSNSGVQATSPGHI